MITLNPAIAAGLYNRGSLEVGKLADLVLVEMGERPRVRATLRRGNPIFWDGSRSISDRQPFTVDTSSLPAYQYLGES